MSFLGLYVLWPGRLQPAGSYGCSGSGFRISGRALGFRVQGFGFGALGFRGLGFRVSGLGL